MSYILFSQTSTANGTRNTWLGATAGQHTTAPSAQNSLNFGVAGLLREVANSTFDEGAARKAVLNEIGGPTAQLATGDVRTDNVVIDRANMAFYDLSVLGGGDRAAFNEVASRLGGIGDVLNTAGTRFADAANNATASQIANDRTLRDNGGYDAATKKLTVAMADVNWNDIKNVEVFLDSATTGTLVAALSVEAFVDARVKIGDTNFNLCFPAANAGRTNDTKTERMKVEILDGKRGQVDASQSDMAVDVAIDVWTNNGGWQNSFASQGSNFNDTFTVNSGQLAWTSGISEFGVGAGTDLGGQSYYNGNLTTLLTNLGRGNDAYTATNGVRIVNNRKEDFELQTADWVWGGSGDDVIRTGGGNDLLFGDFGTATSGEVTISQLGDTTESLWLSVGGSNVANWVNDTGITLYADPVGTGPGLGRVSVSEGNLANRARFEVAQENTGQTAETWATVSGGIGVNGTNGRSNQGDATNPEINAGQDDNGQSDVLGMHLGQLADGARISLSLFYSQDGSSENRIETALVRIGRDLDGDRVLDQAERLGQFVVRADGTTQLLGTTGDVVSDLATTGGPTGQYSTVNGGVLGFSFLSAKDFDLIEFESNGLVERRDNGGYRNLNDTDVSDFYVRSVCYSVAETEGNDSLDGGTGRDRFEGGGDSGRLVLNVDFLSTFAGFNNGFGVYNTNTGTVISGNVKLTRNDFADPYRETISVSDLPSLGYFVLPDANDVGLNGDKVTKVQAGSVTVQRTNNTSVDVAALFSDGKLNKDGAQHAMNDKGSPAPFINTSQDGVAVAEANRAKVEGENLFGRIGFEDLTSNADWDFNDVVFNASLSLVGGDRLFLGAGDNVRDTVVYKAGDGIDFVEQYQRLAGGPGTANWNNSDAIDLDGVTVARADVYTINGQRGLLLTFTDNNAATADDGAMFVVGVTRQSDLIFV